MQLLHNRLSLPLAWLAKMINQKFQEDTQKENATEDDFEPCLAALSATATSYPAAPNPEDGLLQPWLGEAGWSLLIPSPTPNYSCRLQLNSFGQPLKRCSDQVRGLTLTPVSRAWRRRKTLNHTRHTEREKLLVGITWKLYLDMESVNKR